MNDDYYNYVFCIVILSSLFFLYRAATGDPPLLVHCFLHFLDLNRKSFQTHIALAFDMYILNFELSAVTVGLPGGGTELNESSGCFRL